MSDSVRPHRRQPTRLPCPWDSPGKNTGVGCRCLLQCMKVKSESEVAQSCPTLSNPMDCSPPGSFLHPWDFPGESTGVGCHCLLQWWMIYLIATMYSFSGKLCLQALLNLTKKFNATVPGTLSPCPRCKNTAQNFKAVFII